MHHQPFSPPSERTNSYQEGYCDDDSLIHLYLSLNTQAISQYIQYT